MKTKSRRKTSGFFIVEILIVLAIVVILVAALLPNLALYTNRAKFVDVITTADSFKPAVELCILQQGTTGALPTLCDGGSYGIPTSTLTGYATNVSGFTITDGRITTIGAGGALAGVEFILTPTYQDNGAISWATSGSCLTNGLC